MLVMKNFSSKTHFENAFNKFHPPKNCWSLNALQFGLIHCQPFGRGWLLGPNRVIWTVQIYINLSVQWTAHLAQGPIDNLWHNSWTVHNYACTSINLDERPFKQSKNLIVNLYLELSKIKIAGRIWIVQNYECWILFWTVQR